MVRRIFFWSSIISISAILLLSLIWPNVLLLLLIVVPLITLGIYDMNTSNNVLINYPVIGHFRFMFEFVRPEIQQYFVATNLSGRPFNREQRSVVYQRAAGELDTLPFGTQHDITETGYEFAYHSLNPQNPSEAIKRIHVGGSDCKQPYSASILNISAMSFGALSLTAVEAMNLGAKLGNFAQNTGEGGLTPYHLKHGGDVIWQIGTGYFGCRTLDGHFSAEKFKEKSRNPNVKMIEIKLSQGAKPSHGGILPAAKVDELIAQLRGIEIGKDCISPPSHTAFEGPIGLLQFVKQCRELSGGKPVGFKLCIGVRREFMSICKAMLETNILPDFITVDGAEGGTGAAPLEFSNRLGTPINEAIVFVNNCLVGCNLRDSIRVIASGKVTTGFDMITKIALGADMCNSARAMMFAIGCIQALRCNANTCPTGVTSQDPERIKAIVPEQKSKHVHKYHDATVESFRELLGAMGLNDSGQLTAKHILRRGDDDRGVPFSTVFTYLEPGALLSGKIPEDYADDWAAARAETF